MREAQETERLRPAKATRPSIRRSEPPELDQPRLLGVELQGELRQSAAKISSEPLCVITVLKAHHGVVSKPHDQNISVRVPTPPLVRSQVKNVVQVDVAEQR